MELRQLYFDGVIGLVEKNQLFSVKKMDWFCWNYNTLHMVPYKFANTHTFLLVRLLFVKPEKAINFLSFSRLVKTEVK